MLSMRSEFRAGFLSKDTSLLATEQFLMVFKTVRAEFPLPGGKVLGHDFSEGRLVRIAARSRSPGACCCASDSGPVPRVVWKAGLDRSGQSQAGPDGRHAATALRFDELGRRSAPHEPRDGRRVVIGGYRVGPIGIDRDVVPLSVRSYW
jgi:hypothetical protein